MIWVDWLVHHVSIGPVTGPSAWSIVAPSQPCKPRLVRWECMLSCPIQTQNSYSIHAIDYLFGYLSRMWLFNWYSSTHGGWRPASCFLHMRIVPLLVCILRGRKDFSAHFKSLEDAAKIGFLLSVAVCLTLDNFVLGAIPAKRQLCDSDNLPANCRPLLTTTITTAAFPNATSFIYTYCGDDCAQPLYNYFRDCDVPNSKN